MEPFSLYFASFRLITRAHQARPCCHTQGTLDEQLQPPRAAARGQGHLLLLGLPWYSGLGEVGAVGLQPPRPFYFQLELL